LNSEFGRSRSGIFAQKRRCPRNWTAIVGAGTPVGGNYRAAARAKSRADFVAKLGIVEEECDEAAYWMEVIMALKLLKPSRLAKLHVEAGELLAIIVASIKTARRAPRS